MSRQTLYKKRKRELGLCAWGGCNVRTGDSYTCPTHTAKLTGYKRVERERRRRARAAERVAA